MDEEEEISGVYRHLPVQHSNDDNKLPEVESSKSQQSDVLSEIDDSQLVGGSSVDDSRLVGGSSGVLGVEDSEIVVGDTLVVEDMEDSKLVEESPNVVAEMDDSKLVGNPLVVSEVEDLKLNGSPKIVGEINDSSLVGNDLVVEDMDDSKVVEEPKIDADMEDSQLVENPLGVADMDDSKLIEDPKIVADMDDDDDTQVIGKPLVVEEEMEDSKLVGDLAKMEEDSELVGGTVNAVDRDNSRLVGDSPVVPEMDDKELVGGDADKVAEDDLVGGSPVIPDMDDTELVGGSPVVEEDSLVEDEATPLEEVVDMDDDDDEETDVTEASTRGGRKRKRGRAVKTPPKALPRKRTTEEDVCFICFDGGDLVLCDRRGCPKAYHPSCVNRDEAFFRSKGRWNCGWHICSNCEKAAQYMCYTCTYSLCKSCIKEAEFSCVRGNKGFCQTCMRTVMLVEKNEQANTETAQVDFDDKNSWEYLFKDYWIDLKGKLSLTLEELTQARNPSKGSAVSARKEESSDELYNANKDRGSNSDSCSEHLEVSSSKKRKAKKKSKPSTKESVSSSAAIAAGSGGISMTGDSEWASKELLEFVAHMKNGDTSILSQFDVQALLLDYIKQKDLRDPRRKSQIVCDTRLGNLFGKARVGHFEMLKLLESHFLVKEDAQADNQEGNVDTEASQLDAEGNSEVSTKSGADKRRKTRKKAERGLQTNVDDYAAIDVHNINLVYLKRNLAEDLLEDMDTFHDKVVGSFVKIKITGAGQKQEMYRLVQVVGTGKASEPYETGKRTTDVQLEILNLDKTEIETIDRISSQDVSEDECKRLRQSIKCGLISRLTVGDIQEKAMALHSVRVNDWLEAEKLRLSHLRDRASEKGRRKELRECVEKLQLLNTPEERYRRLQEIPEVHTDPNMDPSHESEEEEAEPESYMRSRDAGFSRKGREPISPGKGGSNLNDTRSGSRKSVNSPYESSRNTSTRGSWDKRGGGVEGTNESSWSQGRDSQQSSSWEKSRNQAAASGLESDSWSDQAVVRTEPSSQTTPTALPTGAAIASSASEAEKIWHYKDPSGKIQGPFSMVQLRKWSTTGYFPADMKIWRTTEQQEDSIPLTNALNGKFQKEVPQWDNFSTPQRGTSGFDNNRVNNSNSGRGGNNSSTYTDKSWSSNSKDTSVPANGNSPLLIVKPAETSYHGERTDFQNPPTPTPSTSGGNWTNIGWVGQSPNPGVNGVLQSVTGPIKDAAEWGGHSPTPGIGGRNPGSLSASISPPDSLKPAEGGANSIAANNNSMGIQGFVPSPAAPANPIMSTWNSSCNGYNKPPEENQGWRSDSAHQIQNIIVDHPRHGGLNSQEWGTPPQKQELPASSPTTPAQAGNYPNPGFPVANSVQPPFTQWSPTPSTQSSNPWGASPNMQPPPVAPIPNMQLPPPMAGPGTQLPPPMPTGPHMQPSPVPAGPYMQQPLVAPNQGWGPPQGNANMGWGGSAPVQGNVNMAAWGAPQPLPQGNSTGTMQQRGNTNMGWGSPAANNMSGSQQKHDGNRFSGNRDRGGFHGGGNSRDSNHSGGGGRQSWNRQSSFSDGARGGGGGGSSRPPNKGQRICKYYDSGTCRRGANCDYIHP